MCLGGGAVGRRRTCAVLRQPNQRIKRHAKTQAKKKVAKDLDENPLVKRKTRYTKRSFLHATALCKVVDELRQQ